MAVRKGTKTRVPVKTAPGSARGGRGKKAPNRGTEKSWVVLFWLAFIIFIFGFFLFNRQAISSGFGTMRDEIAARRNLQEEPRLPEQNNRVLTAPELRVSTQPPPPVVSAPPAASSGPAPRTQTPSQPVPPPQPAAAVRQTEAPPTPTQVTPQTAPQPERSSELRERALYFTQVDRSGIILRIRVNRRLPASDSPMTDVLHALIDGPNGDERSRGLISLIPPGTQILSATVRGDTAYINFSEDFQYNTYGVEGYAAQLKEIVFTVTEFPNIRNVQILIEGRPVDYLGEGIWIGSPLSRDML